MESSSSSSSSSSREMDRNTRSIIQATDFRPWSKPQNSLPLSLHPSSSLTLTSSHSLSPSLSLSSPDYERVGPLKRSSLSCLHTNFFFSHLCQLCQKATNLSFSLSLSSLSLYFITGDFVYLLCAILMYIYTISMFKFYLFSQPSFSFFFLYFFPREARVC